MSPCFGLRDLPHHLSEPSHLIGQTSQLDNLHRSPTL